MLRHFTFRALIVALAGWLVVSTGAVLAVTLAGGDPNSRAVILMGTGLVVLWVGVCGTLMVLGRRRVRALVLGVRVDWRVRFVAMATLLALGSAGMARRLGRGTDRFLYTAKGLEIPGHSARGVQSMALGYATATRGGSHHDTRPNYAAPYDGAVAENHAAYSVQSQDWSAVGDSLAICRFVGERGFGAEYHAAMATLLRLITGWDVGTDELATIGARIWNAERAANVRRGMRRADDALPWRATHEPIPAGPAAGRFCPEATLEALLDSYYEKRGWDRDGVPTEALLEKLGIPAISAR